MCLLGTEENGAVIRVGATQVISDLDIIPPPATWPSSHQYPLTDSNTDAGQKHTEHRVHLQRHQKHTHTHTKQQKAQGYRPPHTHTHIAQNNDNKKLVLKFASTKLSTYRDSCKNYACSNISMAMFRTQNRCEQIYLFIYLLFSHLNHCSWWISFLSWYPFLKPSGVSDFCPPSTFNQISGNNIPIYKNTTFFMHTIHH